MLSVKVLEELSTFITNPDFSISSDSYETLKDILLTQRDSDGNFIQFIAESKEEILSIFDSLQKENNYFAKRESLKTLYQLLKN